MGTLLRVPIIRTIVYWGSYWGPPPLGNYHTLSTQTTPKEITTPKIFQWPPDDYYSKWELYRLVLSRDEDQIPLLVIAVHTKNMAVGCGRALRDPGSVCGDYPGTMVIPGHGRVSKQ